MELRLPVSKADYKGTGASRRLACCCTEVGGPERCAAHTLRRQWRLRLEEADRDPDEWTCGTKLPPEVAQLPLFPDNEGGVPEKAKVVEAWRTVAPAGHDEVGGHTPRRSGAKRRARMGWSLNLIMLLGRWASPAVMGYVEEAISELVFGGATASSGTGEGPAPQDDWEVALPSLSKRMDTLEQRLAEFRRSLDESSARTVRSELAAVAVKARDAPEPLRWLRSTRANGKYHREASRWKGAPSWAWVTGCGWRFGLSEHYEFVTEREARNAGPLWCDKGCDME